MVGGVGPRSGASRIKLGGGVIPILRSFFLVKTLVNLHILFRTAGFAH